MALFTCASAMEFESDVQSQLAGAPAISICPPTSRDEVGTLPMDMYVSERLSVNSGEPPVSPSTPFSKMKLGSPITPNSSMDDLDGVGFWEEGWSCTLYDKNEVLDDFCGDILLDENPPTQNGPTLFPPKLENGENELVSKGQAYPHPSPSPGFSFQRRHTDGGVVSKHEPFLSFIRNVGKASQAPLEATHPDYASIYAAMPTLDRSSTLPTPGSQANGSNCDYENLQKWTRDEQPRRPSLSSRCSSCISLYHHPITPGQRIFLDQLPTEILLVIFEYAYLFELPRCEHKRKLGGITRRLTADSLPHETLTPTPASASSSKVEEPPRLPEGLRIYRAKTLLYIALTSRRFNEILWDPYIDHKFWRNAARKCWDWLPEELAGVQGTQVEHQSSWRNLVGVFMRSENGQFGQEGGGKGGVESFGGNKECMQAVLWKDEQARKGLQMKASKKRKLLMVCAQPGPDLFHISYDAERRQHTVSLSLRGGADYFVTIDEYGRFSKKPARLPGGLKRNERNTGYFPPDIFGVEGDRFQLVKVLKRRDHPSAAPHKNDSKAKHHPKPEVEEIVTWDLSCVPEYESDTTATVARCTSKNEWLAFNLFCHRDRDESSIELLFDPPLDPPEDQRLFCVQAFGYPGCKTHAGAATATTSEKMSEKRRGKMRETDYTPMELDNEEPQTVFRWCREFEYARASDFDAARRLHYVICSLQLNSTKAAVLVRWNIRSSVSPEELVDRQFQILDLKTGATIHVLQFPNLYWDHRHHDMCVDYNRMRHEKMCNLYNYMGYNEVMGAGNRCTRIHEDKFILTEDKIISGSHDYCNWVWDLNAKPKSNTETLVFDAEQNDAGKADPFTVLDDFYWNEDKEKPAKKGEWNTKNERAGWWVRTPNQVLCYWHGIANSVDNRYFAACRPGKMFVWDLKDEQNSILGFQNFSGGGNNRWLGRLAGHVQKLQHRLRNWFVWEKVLPEQGLWLLFDDLEAVYLDRDDILDACSLNSDKRTWPFQKEYFTFLNHERKVPGFKREDCPEEDEDGDYEDSESDEGSPHLIKRRRTNSFSTEYSSTDEEPRFMFEGEREMDDH